ncbi:MAG: CmcI family methyltransferase [Opitutaceae bacterium]|jgi:predicted O-methyltransferase YrrM
MSFLRDNIAPRLRLLRTALSRRFIYPDVVKIAEEYGLSYSDLRADTEPFEFVRRLLTGTTAPPPDFAALIEPSEGFTPPGAPDIFNSEPSVGRFLGQLTYYLKAQSVVELGCFVGWSSAHMALALKSSNRGGRLFCVDYMQHYLDVAIANLKRHGLSDVATPVCGKSLDAAVMAALPGRIDMVFLDTSHAYPATRDEILAYAPRLTTGGCLVLHDSTKASGVRRSLLEVGDRFRVLTFATEQSNGVTVLRPR